MKKKSAPTTCAPKTAVAYARYSSAGQRDVSIEQQLQDIRSYAQREGYTIVHEYADHARSGFKSATTRAAFQAMIRAAKTGAFDSVLIWKTDRFSRNREDSARYKGQLKRLGVKTVTVMEPIPEGSAGILLESMLEATAEWYSQTLSENVSRGMYDNARRCMHNGVRVLGYDFGPDGHYVENPEESAIVRLIFSRYASGCSAATIVRELNGKSLTNINGHPFTTSNILWVINNERYIGVYHWGDVRIPDGMPAIISKSQFEEAQRMKKKTARHIEQGAVDYILTGKAYCGHCGAAMIGDSGTSRTGDRHYYYSCQAHKARKGCDKKSVGKEYLEDTVINFIFDHVLQDPEINRIADAVTKAQAEASKSSPLASLKSDLAEVKKKIANVNGAIAQGIYTSSTLDMLRDLEAEATDLQKSIDFTSFAESQLIDHDRVIFFLHQMTKGDRQDVAFRKYIIEVFINAIYLFDDHFKLVINNVEGNLRYPLDALPGSDNESFAPPNTSYPNHLVTVYVVPLVRRKKRA